MHKLRREPNATQAHAEAASAIASQHGYTQMVTLATILRGWALIAQGHTDEGVLELQRGIEAWRATGTEDGRPYFLALLAEAYSKVARVGDGLTLLDEAIAVLHKNGERVHEAYVHHLKGCLLLSCSATTKVQTPDSSPEAEACFQHALHIARQQHAKAMELRVTISLSRLWVDRGKNAQARQLLSRIYDWFTEAHSVDDLREAETLLRQLS